MKKVRIIVLALASMLTLLALGAGSAWAAGEALLDGAALPAGETAADAEGGLELTDLKVPIFGETTVSAEGILHTDLTLPTEAATVTRNGHELLSWDIGQILSFLSLTGVENEAIAKGIKGACGTAAEAATVKPLNFPWLVLLLRNDTTGVYYIQFMKGPNGLPAYEVICKSSGLTDVCEGEVAGIATNNAELGDVTTAFSLTEQETEKETAKCSAGGAESGHINGTGLTFLTGANAGLTLALSGE